MTDAAEHARVAKAGQAKQAGQGWPDLEVGRAKRRGNGLLVIRTRLRLHECGAQLVGQKTRGSRLRQNAIDKSGDVADAGAAEVGDALVQAGRVAAASLASLERTARMAFGS